MKLKVFTWCMLMALAPATAQAFEARTKGGYPACITEEMFDEAVGALVAQDSQYFAQLKGCIITRTGLKMHVLDYGFGTSKVRIFTPDGQSMIMWTNTENISKQ